MNLIVSKCMCSSLVYFKLARGGNSIAKGAQSLEFSIRLKACTNTREIRVCLCLWITAIRGSIISLVNLPEMKSRTLTSVLTLYVRSGYPWVLLNAVSCSLCEWLYSCPVCPCLPWVYNQPCYQVDLQTTKQLPHLRSQNNFWIKACSLAPIWDITCLTSFCG